MRRIEGSNARITTARSGDDVILLTVTSDTYSGPVTLDTELSPQQAALTVVALVDVLGMDRKALERLAAGMRDS